MRTNEGSTQLPFSDSPLRFRVPPRAASFGLALSFLALLGVGLAQGQTPPSPFRVYAALTPRDGTQAVTFHFEVPPGNFLNAGRFAFETADGTELKPAVMPQPVLHRDPATGQEKSGYDHSFTAELVLPNPLPASLLVKFQGCSNSACYFPERHRFQITSAGIVAQADAPAQAPADAAPASPGPLLASATAGLQVAARETGYIPKHDFLNLLNRVQAGQVLAHEAAGLERFGPVACVSLIVLGGLGLNLTPCVLPLIPINLAIIGAGARASSRRRGFALGAAYGLGMALVYGVLGLVVVLTGSKFGTLNSSGWFNLGIALVFLVLALGMFDKLNIDLSRFRKGGARPDQTHRGQFALAFGMGAMAALLAGACVAPVVISVLLLAAHLYAKGIVAGLVLPFLLGLGMALPWPFAGAGLSFLPKPGKWMKHVKYGFGVLILLFAGYYGSLAYHLFGPGSLVASARSQPLDPATTPEARLAAALEQARAQQKPILIDFAASWCKNCVAMDETVFPAAEVQQKLKGFIFVRYDAEKPNEPPARAVLNQFGVLGLPTYVVLKPE